MVIVLRGCSGSGKSTWVDVAGASYKDVRVFSADHYFLDSEGEYQFDPTKLGEAHGECLRKFTVAVMTSREATLIVDNTNTTAVDVAPYAALALAYGHDLKVVTLLCDPEVAHARNRHGVPLATVGMQYERLTRSAGKLSPWWPEQIIRVEDLSLLND